MPGRGKLKRQDVEHLADEEPVHVPLNGAAIAALGVVHGRRDRRGRVFKSAGTGGSLENGRH